jgi:hypothetical protein
MASLVRKLVLVSTPFKRSGWHAENLAGMSQMSAQAADFMKQTPMYHTYASIAPRPDGWDGAGMSAARLAVLPGLTHYNIFDSPALGETIRKFLG